MSCCGTAQPEDHLLAQLGGFGARWAGVQSSGGEHSCLPQRSVLHYSVLTAGEMEEYTLKETLTQHAEAGVFSFIYQTASGLMLDEQILLGLWVWGRDVSSPCSRAQRG